MLLRTLALVVAIAAPAAAQAQPVTRDCPRFEDSRCIVDAHMRRGTETMVFRGVITQQHEGYSYKFRARAGQVLTWKVNGPATRQVIAYPNGDADGPGIPNKIDLKQTGEYTFTVSADLMAEGAFGPFTLTMTIK